jgi:hypothetical protein
MTLVNPMRLHIKSVVSKLFTLRRSNLSDSSLQLITNSLCLMLKNCNIVHNNKTLHMVTMLLDKYSSDDSLIVVHNFVILLSLPASQ